MNAYLPSGLWVAASLALIMGGTVLTGFCLTRFASVRAARISGWAILVFGTVGVERLCAHEAPGVRMAALLSFALLAIKGIVAVEAQAGGMSPLSFAMWLGFAIGWPGMQPRIFASRRPEATVGASKLIRMGLFRLLAGALLVLLARASFQAFRSYLVMSALLLPGISLMVHFGLCTLAAGIWRRFGFPCDPLFRAPLKSKNLKEFWGRRWNLAFSEMSAVIAYRPLARWLGQGPALLATFLLSGLLHEMAISLPVRAGFGLPTLYFLIHGGLVLLERLLAAKGRPIQGWFGRIWAMAWLAIPLPLLFHRPFLAGVIWPLIGIEAGR